MLDILNDFPHLPVQVRYLIGWGSTLACFLICYYSSKRLSWRLSAVMALLGSAWVLTLTGYALPDFQSLPSQAFAPTQIADRAGDVASFLLVYAGALLSLEGTPGKWMNAQLLQAPAMWLLFCLVMPPGLLDALAGAAPRDPRYLQAYELGFALALTGAGFLSLVLGVYAVASRAVFSTVAVIALLYFVGIAFRHAQLFTSSSRVPLATLLVLLYAVAKLALTAIIAIVALRLEPEKPQAS